MLGKIIKYEWRATWKVNTLLLGIFWGTTILMQLLGLLPIWDSDEWSALAAIAMLFLFYGVMLCFIIGVPLYLTIRYYKSMYSNEGYLTHTLPITGNQLFLGKLIHFVIWRLITMLSAILGVLMFIVVFIKIVSDEEMSTFGLLREFWQNILGLGEYGLEWNRAGILLILAVLVYLIYIPLKCMGAVNVGQLWKTHKVAGTIGIYLGIYVVERIVTFVVMMLYNVYASIVSFDYYFDGSLALALVGQLVVGTVMFLVSELIIKNKINLE